jgi:hypothetical protein
MKGKPANRRKTVNVTLFTYERLEDLKRYVSKKYQDQMDFNEIIKELATRENIDAYYAKFPKYDGPKNAKKSS